MDKAPGFRHEQGRKTVEAAILGVSFGRKVDISMPCLQILRIPAIG
jgi:hypothetical protein